MAPLDKAPTPPTNFSITMISGGSYKAGQFRTGRRSGPRGNLVGADVVKSPSFETMRGQGGVALPRFRELVQRRYEALPQHTLEQILDSCLGEAKASRRNLPGESAGGRATLPLTEPEFNLAWSRAQQQASAGLRRQRKALEQLPFTKLTSKSNLSKVGMATALERVLGPLPAGGDWQLEVNLAFETILQKGARECGADGWSKMAAHLLDLLKPHKTKRAPGP